MKYGVMQMRTEVLRYLLEVNEQKSISKAANHLYLSKSALSESISQLEKELNLTIFQRTKKGVTTTEVGAKIIEQAKVVLDNVEKIYQISFSAPPLVNYAYTITFGVGEKFALAGLSESISFILQKYPDVTFNAINMNIKQCMEALVKEEIQFAITGCLDFQKEALLEQMFQHSLRYIMLLDDPLYAVVNKASPLAEKSYLTLADCQACKMITYSNVSDDNQLNAIYLSTFDNILQLLNDNVGISLFPHSLVQNLNILQRDNLTVIPVVDMVQCNFIIYPAQQPVTELQRLFMMLYRQKFAQCINATS